MKRIWFILGLVVLDQITKFLFEVHRNTGIAFGLLQGQMLLIILVSIFVIFLCVKYMRENVLAFSLILSGVIGNLIDRIMFGAVRDFVSLPLLPLVNLADVLITAGIVILVFSLLIKKHH